MVAGVSALISITLPSLYRLSANCPPPISGLSGAWSGTIDAPTGHSQPVSPPSHLAQSRFPTCRQPLKLPGSHLRRPVRDPRQTGPSARPSRGAVAWEGLVLSETDGMNRAVA